MKIIYTHDISSVMYISVINAAKNATN